MREYKKIGMKAGILLVATTLIMTSLLITHTEPTIIDDITNPLEIKTMRSNWEDFYLTNLGDADPGSGASGVLISGFAKEGVTWTSNLTYGTDTYHTTETNNTHAGDNIPYGTNVYPFWKLRLNVSDLVETSGADTYMLNYISGWLNCTGLSVSSLELTEVNITGVTNCDTNFIFVHYYAGPYTWQRGQNITGFNAKWRIFK